MSLGGQAFSMHSAHYVYQAQAPGTELQFKTMDPESYKEIYSYVKESKYLEGASKNALYLKCSMQEKSLLLYASDDSFCIIGDGRESNSMWLGCASIATAGARICGWQGTLRDKCHATEDGRANW